MHSILNCFHFLPSVFWWWLDDFWAKIRKEKFSDASRKLDADANFWAEIMGDGASDDEDFEGFTIENVAESEWRRLTKDEETARVIRQLENSMDSDTDSEEDEFEQPPSTTVTTPSQNHHNYNFIITINVFTIHSMQLTQTNQNFICNDFFPTYSMIFVQSSKFTWFTVLVNRWACLVGEELTIRCCCDLEFRSRLLSLDQYEQEAVNTVSSQSFSCRSSWFCYDILCSFFLV